MRVEVARELKTIREKYADPRRTVVVSSCGGRRARDGFPGAEREYDWVTLTESGLISRTFGEGAPRITEEQSDPPLAMLGSNTTHTLYLLTAEGQAGNDPDERTATVGKHGAGGRLYGRCARSPARSR